MYFILFYVEISWIDNILLYWILIRRIEFIDCGVKKQLLEKNSDIYVFLI